MAPDCGSAAGMPGLVISSPLNMVGLAVLDGALFAGVTLGDILVSAPMGFSMDHAMETRGGLLPGVADAVAQDGDGQSGLFGIERDEGAEGFEGNIDGKSGIVEGDLGDGEFAGEGGAFEAGKAGSVFGAESVGAFVGGHEAGFEHVGDRLATPGLRPDGGEGVFRANGLYRGG